MGRKPRTSPQGWLLGHFWLSCLRCAAAPCNCRHQVSAHAHEPPRSVRSAEHTDLERIDQLELLEALEPLEELEPLALDDDALEPEVLDDPEEDVEDAIADWIRELTA